MNSAIGKTRKRTSKGRDKIITVVEDEIASLSIGGGGSDGGHPNTDDDMFLSQVQEAYSSDSDLDDETGSDSDGSDGSSDSETEDGPPVAAAISTELAALGEQLRSAAAKDSCAQVAELIDSIESVGGSIDVPDWVRRSAPACAPACGSRLCWQTCLRRRNPPMLCCA